MLALVNGRQITQTEFDARWGELAEATKARYLKEGGKRLFLDELITKELLMQEARKLGLDQNDAIRDRTQRYREQLILDELLKDRIKAKVELSKEELDAFYEQHANELLPPLKVRVSQMLLPNISAAKDLEK
ncbi:MAG: SurA N-terminal domain-containing protein, partial [Nitrospirota bacterium]